MNIITVVGARPQFIKAATISRAINNYNINNNKTVIHEKIIHTGQHYDSNMSDVFFEEMSIPEPTFTLGIGDVSHGAMTGRQIEKIEEILIGEKPDYVLVYGDTNSTLAGALAAVKIHIPVIHVEAGLRSFNMKMPEEVNRILTDKISALLFCPTEGAVANLKMEGFGGDSQKIYNVGDVMYDAAMFYSNKSIRPEYLDATVDHFILTTIHRADNTDNLARLKEIVAAINEICLELPVVCPLHPRTLRAIKNADLNLDAIIIPPVGYFEMIWLIKNCTLVLTDSGGLQKEAYFFEKPCITLRDQTEWVELIEVKANKLVGAEKHNIIRSIREIGVDYVDWSQKLYGNADASLKILNNILAL